MTTEPADEFEEGRRITNSVPKWTKEPRIKGPDDVGPALKSVQAWVHEYVLPDAEDPTRKVYDELIRIGCAEHDPLAFPSIQMPASRNWFVVQGVATEKQARLALAKLVEAGLIRDVMAHEIKYQNLRKWIESRQSPPRVVQINLMPMNALLRQHEFAGFEEEGESA